MLSKVMLAPAAASAAAPSAGHAVVTETRPEQNALLLLRPLSPPPEDGISSTIVLAVEFPKLAVEATGSVCLLVERRSASGKARQDVLSIIAGFLAQ